MGLKALYASFILIVGLLVSSVLSLMWMLLVQVSALAGLIFIGTVFVKSQKSEKPPEYDIDHDEDFR